MKRNNLVFVMLMTAFGAGAAHAQISVAIIGPDYALEQHIALIKEYVQGIWQSKGCEYQGKLFPVGFKGNTESNLAGKVCALEQDYEVKDGLRVPLRTYTAKWKMNSLH